HGFDVKMYLMYGFKNESLDDIRVMLDSIRKIASRAREKGVKVKISLNLLIPKPHTVFQWIGMIDLVRAREILRYIKRELPGYVDTKLYEINYAWVQSAISLSDQSISDVLIQWGLEGGGLGSWRRVLKKTGFSTKYVFEGYRFGEKLPWSNIALNEDLEKILLAEYEVWRRIIRC
ncbi:MAG: radical SAM protein, partial [Desulfurococcaceae archaeon]